MLLRLICFRTKENAEDMGKIMTNNKCKFIVIDGLDGSGKATQSQLLSKRLCEMGYKARTISFPDYESDSSALVKMYLGGKLGSSPDDVNAYAASTFYAVDRVASYINTWRKDYESYDYIIADRYTTSNIIHQMAKVAESERDSYIEWLFDFEYKRLELPAPDMVIFLDVDPAISQKLIYGRYGGDESKKDIHESDFSYLEKSYENAKYVASKFGWQTVPCVKDGNIRPIADIQADIVKIVENLL